ncbi:hypothetical protein D1872_350220 [compost metagenome]
MIAGASISAASVPKAAAIAQAPMVTKDVGTPISLAVCSLEAVTLTASPHFVFCKK